MPIFFVEENNINADIINISSNDDVKHICQVLRYKIGDILNLAIKNGCVYTTEILSIDKNNITCKVINKNVSDKKLKINLSLAQSIIKSGKQDIIIQKATELGVKNIHPLITDNSVVKFDSGIAKSKKIEKWQKIADESCKQCERIDFPVVHNIQTLSDFLQNNPYDFIIACVERNAQTSIKSLLRDNLNESISKIVLLIGPEGGWNDKELSLFNKYNIHKVSLGNLIMRAETACVTALSDVIYEFEL